jgi:nitrogen fixation NifU-like protein
MTYSRVDRRPSRLEAGSGCPRPASRMSVGEESGPAPDEIHYMGKYSDILMEHLASPRNSGPLEAPDATGHAGAPGRGPFLILYLRIEGDRVVAARFQTYGCGATIACGSMLTELITGQTIAGCLQLTAETLSEALDGVPPDKLHSLALAIAALRDALRGYAPTRSA